MNPSELRSWLITNAFTKDDSRLNFHAFTPEVKSLLIELTPFFEPQVSVIRRAYAFLTGQDRLHRCITCNRELQPDKYNLQPLYCNLSCAGNSPLNYFQNKKAQQTNLERYGCHPSSLKSNREQAQQTNLELYGFRHASQNPEIIDKMNQTMLERYGVMNAMDSPEIKERLRKTQQEIYGGHPWSNPDVRKRTLVTNMDRYGVEHPLQLEFVQDKARKTNMERYGVPYSLQSPIVKEKSRKTNLERYGVTNPVKNSIIRDKIRSTHLEHYGVPYNSQIHISAENLEKMKDKSWFIENYELHGFDWLVKTLGVTPITIYRHLNSYGIEVMQSNEENNFYHFLKSVYPFKIIVGSHKIIPPLELDFYLPEHNLAIEYDGIYWHTDRIKDKNYHLLKTQLCASKDIQLLHIFSTDPLDIWRSVISSKLNIYTNKIGARQTIIREVNNEESWTFLKENHLQGPINGSIRLGLYYLDELVSLMTFGKSRFNKNYEYELLRFCNKQNWSVRGAASKLLKYANLDSIVSYANMRWSTGDLYDKLGFKLLNISKPNYFYTNDYRKLYSRNHFQKHKLAELEGFDPNLTEGQNMQNLGYDRLYDCGNMVYGLGKTLTNT